MRIRTLALSGLSGICALTLACSDGENPPTAPATPDAAAATETSGPALSLFGLGDFHPGRACRSKPYRQFDFWVGNWEVTTGGPSKAASFETSEVGGCALFEDWHGAAPPGGGGQRGRSMNVYDASDHQWHQHWVENSGFFPLRLDGRFRNGAMVMQESYPDPRGTPTVFTDRYTWTRLGSDDVRQFVEQSTDGGVTFAPAFDGRYHRNANPAVPKPSVFPFCTSTDPGLSLFQEFNFTVGRWNVELDRPGEAAAATSQRHDLQSSTRTDLDGCLIEEKLTGPQGYEARVFTNIRPIDEIWRRTYVDNQGLRIYLTGPRLKDGKIVMTGSMPKPGGPGTQQVRAVFLQTGPDRFVERWQTKQSGAWEPLVTARYIRQ